VVAIIERDADIRLAADTLVTAAFSLRGKSPYKPDIVLVNEWVKKDFLVAVMQSLVRLMADPGDSRILKKQLKSSFLEDVAKEGFTDVVCPNTGQLVLSVEDRYGLTTL
jgi:acyl-CoA reductase-like NAD-dependent aldehyde dehydrogenase